VCNSHFAQRSDVDRLQNMIRYNMIKNIFFFNNSDNIRQIRRPGNNILYSYGTALLRSHICRITETLLFMLAYIILYIEYNSGESTPSAFLEYTYIILYTNVNATIHIYNKQTASGLTVKVYALNE